jgi:Rps23 Pro-64 3,4-dihydroxylase Tpa1-like proline 4-hydroxylase
MNSKLLQNNYIVIPNFISSYRAIELAEEFKHYCKNKNLTGDPQAPNSYSDYNYISFLELLTEKTQEISSILEETVLPTYVYSRVYFNGSVLERHRDRDACEISLTLHLNGDKPWPISIQTPSGEERSVTLNPGDAMMYLGKIADHWRDTYDGEYYTQVFLHYVRSRGDCSYAYFDKKKENDNKEDEKMNQVIEKKEEKISTPTLMVPQSRTKLEDYIHVFDNILPRHFCQEILEEYKHCDEWAPALVGGGIEHRNSRNCDQILTSDHNSISRNEEIRRSIDERIHKCMMEAMEQYKEKHSLFNVEIDTGYQLLRYQEGQYYTQHTDSFKAEQRSVSCSIQLNEDYEGGEFAFFDKEIIMRTGTGSVIMFPSNFMYPHEVMPVQKGTRYSIITWFV